MQHTFSKIYIHLVWATKDREPILFDKVRREILSHIRETAVKHEIHIDTINSHLDHIHTLVSLSPNQSVSEIVNELKGESSHWINEQKLMNLKFGWQRGFGAFSVNGQQLQTVREYIINQDEHHKRKSFAEEWDDLLRIHNITA